MVNELSEAESSHAETQSRLRACEKEVGSLKNQLQQYVEEVRKAEDLLYRKVVNFCFYSNFITSFIYWFVRFDGQDEEREEMLEHYKSLSQDAVTLEGNNNSLEAEAAEARYVQAPFFRCIV